MRLWLIQLRENNRLTQQQVAEEIGVTRQTISALEKGTSNPSVALAKSLANLLQFKWTDFF